jgi:hypothetical protein
VRDKVYRYITAGKFFVLRVLIFKFLDNRLEEEILKLVEEFNDKVDLQNHRFINAIIFWAQIQRGK